MTTIEDETPAPETGAVGMARPANNERAHLLVGLNNTGVEFPRDIRIHQLIEEQVRRTPSATAVIGENGRLTYRELNGRASQVMHRVMRQHADLSGQRASRPGGQSPPIHRKTFTHVAE